MIMSSIYFFILFLSQVLYLESLEGILTWLESYTSDLKSLKNPSSALKIRIYFVIMRFTLLIII